MNWDRIEGNWHQLKGNAQQCWGKLTADHLHVLAGRRDQLAGKIQNRRGLSCDAQKQQLSDWNKRLKASNTFK